MTRRVVRVEWMEVAKLSLFESIIDVGASAFRRA